MPSRLELTTAALLGRKATPVTGAVCSENVTKQKPLPGVHSLTCACQKASAIIAAAFEVIATTQSAGLFNGSSAGQETLQTHNNVFDPIAVLQALVCGSLPRHTQIRQGSLYPMHSRDRPWRRLLR